MQKKAGFTLIELVLVIIILSVIAAMSSTSLMQGFTSYTTSQSSSVLDWQANIALERMSRELRSMGNTLGVTAPNQVSFFDANANQVSYWFVGENLYEGIEKFPGNILVSNVTGLTFQYYDRTGTLTANVRLIRYIKITLTVASAGIQYVYSTAVFLSNIP